DSRLHHSLPQRKTFSKCVFVLLIAGVAIVGGSCQKGAHENKCVPIKGKFTTSATETGIVGTGTESRIGRFTLVAEDQVSFPNITGTVIITTANGDKIFATHTGKIEPQANDMLKVHLDNTIKGGTGRFAGATGSFSIDDLVDGSTGNGNATFDGTICY
ncbi:MAG: hypothetical protein ABIQ00_20350, partial [Chitinophagaceae bacterium]